MLIEHVTLDAFVRKVGWLTNKFSYEALCELYKHLDRSSEQQFLDVKFVLNNFNEYSYKEAAIEYNLYPDTTEDLSTCDESEVYASLVIDYCHNRGITVATLPQSILVKAENETSTLAGI